MDKSTTSTCRVYELPHIANKGKVEKIQDLISLSRTALTICKQVKISQLRDGQKLHRLRNDEWTLPRYAFLSARQWKDIENQVDNALKSWMELAVIEGRRIINSWAKDRELSEQEVIDLRTINKYKRWWDKENGCLELVDQILKVVKFPVFANTRTILVSGLNGCLSPSKFKTEKDIKEGKSPFTEHDQWLSIKVASGKKLDIPVFRTRYFDDQMHSSLRECDLFQITDNGDHITVKQAAEIPTEPSREHGKTLGLDFGLKSIFATSDGRLLGRTLYDWLQDRDQELLELSKSLQRQGIPFKKSKRYRKFTKRIRDYVKNEIGRIINGLSKEDTKEFIVEKLDFRGGGLSKKLNRIISRTGRSVLKSKLKSVQQTYGKSTYEVNPAYTSQECEKCHFVCSKNRKGERFLCKHCGYTTHADVNAAKIIIARRSCDYDGYLYIPKEEILSKRDEAFSSLTGKDPNLLRQRWRDAKVSSPTRSQLRSSASSSNTV